jgi:hypothetical protein
MDLSVFSVKFTSCKRTFGFASMNLAMKAFPVFLLVVISFLFCSRWVIPTSSGLWNLAQQASHKASQLIEVVRPGDMYILADRDFITFTNLFNAKDHNRHLLSYLGTFPDATRFNNDFSR